MKINRTLSHPLLHAMAGLGVWAVAFVVLYGGLSIACRTPLVSYALGPFNAVSLVLIALWLAHVALLSLMVVRAWRSRHHVDPRESAFMPRLTLFLHGTSLIALVALGLPVLFLAPCV